MTQPPYPPYPGPDDAEQPSGGGEQPSDPAPPTEPYGQTPYPQTPYPQAPGQPPYGQTPQPPNPYGQNPPPPNPYGQNPYGQAPQGGQPYGQSPYTSWQGGNDPSRGTDGFSIAAFVTALTCCMGIPAVVLGIIGIRRTREGRMKGRWMAVTGIVLGVLGTLLSVAVIAGIVYLNDVVYPENAEVGMCVDTEDADEDTIDIRKADCSESHDAEIFEVHTITATEAEEHDLDSVTEICDTAAMAEAAFRSGEFVATTIYQTESVDEDDIIVCLLERVDGADLDEKVLD